jgi:hypothetical protein
VGSADDGCIHQTNDTVNAKTTQDTRPWVVGPLNARR